MSQTKGGEDSRLPSPVTSSSLKKVSDSSKMTAHHGATATSNADGTVVVVDHARPGSSSSSGGSPTTSKSKSLKDRLSLSLHGSSKKNKSKDGVLSKSAHGSNSRPSSSGSSSSNKSKSKLSLSLHGLARSLHGSSSGSSRPNSGSSSGTTGSSKNSKSGGTKLSLSLHGASKHGRRRRHSLFGGKSGEKDAALAAAAATGAADNGNNAADMDVEETSPTNKSNKGTNKLSLSLHGASKQIRRRRSSVFGGKSGEKSAMAAAAKAAAAAAAAEGDVSDGYGSGGCGSVTSPASSSRRRRGSLFGGRSSPPPSPPSPPTSQGEAGEACPASPATTNRRRRNSLLKEDMMKKILEQASKVRASFEKKIDSTSKSKRKNQTGNTNSSSAKGGVSHAAFQPYAAFGNTTSTAAPASGSIPTTLMNSAITVSTRCDSSCSTSIGGSGAGNSCHGLNSSVTSSAGAGTSFTAGSSITSTTMMMDPAAIAEQLQKEWQEATAAQAAGQPFSIGKTNSAALFSTGSKRGSFTLGTSGDHNASGRADRRGSFQRAGRRNSAGDNRGSFSSTTGLTVCMRRASLNSRGSSVNSLSVSAVGSKSSPKYNNSGAFPFDSSFHEEEQVGSNDDEDATEPVDVSFTFGNSTTDGPPPPPDMTTSLDPTNTTVRHSSAPVSSTTSNGAVSSISLQRQRRRRASISEGTTTSEIGDITTHADYTGLSRQEILSKLYGGGRYYNASRRRSAGDAELDNYVDESMPRKRQSASSNLDIDDLQDSMDWEEDDNNTAEPNPTSNKPETTRSSMEAYKPDRRVFHRTKRGQHLEETHDWLPAKQKIGGEDEFAPNEEKRKQEVEASRVLIQYQARVNPQDSIMLNIPPYEQIALNSNDVIAMMTSGGGGSGGGGNRPNTFVSKLQELMECCIGNRRFNILLDMHRKKYTKAKTAQYRTKEARAIVQAIHHAVPQGRFLTLDSNGIWTIMPPLWSIHYVERALASFSLRKQQSQQNTIAKTA